MTAVDRKTAEGAVRLFHAQARMYSVPLIARGETARMIAHGGLVDGSHFEFGIPEGVSTERFIEGLRLRGFSTDGPLSIEGISFDIQVVPGKLSNVMVWLCGVSFHREESWNRGEN